jgi:hypothetical protein
MATKRTTKKAAPKQAAETPARKKATRSKTGADGKPAAGSPKTPASTEAPTQPDDGDELVVFAFRLTRTERDLIHQAAGSAKASKFVRGLALAAARGDQAAVKEIVSSTQS